MKAGRVFGAVWLLAGGTGCHTLLVQGFSIQSPPRQHIATLTRLWNKLPSTEDKEAEKTLEKDEGVTLDEMDWETAELERRQAQRVWTNLMLPYEVSRFVTTALWVVVGVGFVLNAFGYAYVWQDGHLTIGTLEQKEFQDAFWRSNR